MVRMRSSIEFELWGAKKQFDMPVALFGIQCCCFVCGKGKRVTTGCGTGGYDMRLM